MKNGAEIGMKIVDMHCDTISEIKNATESGNECCLRENTFMIDLQRMKANHYLVQNFALFVDLKKHAKGFERVQELVRVFQFEMKDNQDIISQVTNTKMIAENEKNGKLSALLTVEEGGVCEGKLENLQILYEQGVRMMTLTWNYPNELGYPNYNARGDLKIPDLEHGLTDLGIIFLEKMERMGIIVDVSHLSDAGFYDVLKYAKKPFVASHSNARAVCNVARNMSDDMIQKLGDRGGVMGLNFSVDFLREYTGTKVFDARNPVNWGLSFATIEDIVCHAKHIANVGGIECVGIGADFDGIPMHPQIQGAQDMVRLIDAFQRAGFHESEVEKIFYKNVMRVYKEVLDKK